MDVIRSALNELGCEELPLGYDLSMESTFVDSPVINKVIGILSIAMKERSIVTNIIFMLLDTPECVSDCNIGNFHAFPIVYLA